MLSSRVVGSVGSDSSSGVVCVLDFMFLLKLNPPPKQLELLQTFMVSHCISFKKVTKGSLFVRC